MAQQNGFDNTIPVWFANIKFTSGEDDPTRQPTATPIPLSGVLGGLGCAAVLAYVFRRT